MKSYLTLTLLCSFALCNRVLRVNDDSVISLATKNVLANEFCWPSFYHYASPGEHLHWNVRFPKQLSELRCYNADLLTLQEVDRFDETSTKPTFRDNQDSSLLSGYWADGLGQLGYNSEFASCHASFVGVSTAFKDERWIKLGSGAIDLSLATEHIKEAQVNTVLYTVLQDQKRSNDGVILVTSHLHRSLDSVRAHQALIIMDHIQELKAEYPDYPAVWAGDFNMTPDSAAYSLITGHEGIYHDDFWSRLQNYKDEADEAGITHRIHGTPAIDWAQIKEQVVSYDALSYAVDVLPGTKVTHKTDAFEGRLDYVFTYPAFSGQELILVGDLDLPEGDEVQPMPNAENGSDHYALFCIFKYRF